MNDDLNLITQNKNNDKIRILCKCKGVIHRLRNSSAHIVIYKRTIPENFEFRNEYVCKLITIFGEIWFTAKRFKHKKLIRYRIPKAIADSLIPSTTATHVIITILYNKEDDTYCLIVVEEELLKAKGGRQDGDCHCK